MDINSICTGGDFVSFINRLSVGLSLKIAGKSWSVPGGNIKRMEVALHPWGFEVDLSFWLVSQAKQSEDTLFAKFSSSAAIEASLKIDRTFDTVGEKADPLALSGIVEARSVLERSFEDLSGGPVLHRRYDLQFRDSGAVKWDEHRPITLLTDSTLGQLVAAENPSGLSVTSKWKGSTTKYPVLSLGLGQDSGGASFRDFLFYLAEREGFGVQYDPDTGKYVLDEAKPKGKTEPLVKADIEAVEIIFDPPPRHSVQVKNGAAEAKTKVKKVDSSLAFSGVRHDQLIRSPVAADLDAAATAARAPLVAPPARLRIQFARYPSITMRALRPYDFSDNFSSNIFSAKKIYRLNHLKIVAIAERQAATDDSDDPTNSYCLEVVGDFEQTTDSRWVLPSDRTVPAWPFHVEGKVVSDQGAKDEGTYQAYEDTKSKIEHHFVAMPLFGGKKVRVPYHPNLTSGHFYFPPYRDERVLVGLSFDRAQIDRYLDWRPGARLPKTSQGNHILFGKKAESQTSVRHVYEGAQPVLTVHRTSGKDTQTMVISEGTIKLETREKK